MENHDRQQVAEVYTISQVADLTGVPENTIRSWERRFGLPSPDRTAGKQRRYSRSDLDLIQSIQAARDAGQSMDQAIAGATGVGKNRPPTPLQVVAPNAAPPDVPDERSYPASAMAGRLATELARSNLTGGNLILSDAFLAFPFEAVIQHVLLASADAIRARAMEGNLDPVLESQARDWIERKLQAAYEASGPDSGDQHLAVVGLDASPSPPVALGIAIALSRGGFRTTHAEVGPRPTLVRDLVTAIQPSSVVIHASTADGQSTREGAIRLVDELRVQGVWDGHFLVTGDAPRSATISPVRAIGEDMATIAGRVRQALGTHHRNHGETQ